VNGKLYVVATPLGNLGDLSHRAGEILRSVDLVAAEDTRRSRVLLQHVDARPRVVSFHAHSTPARLTELVEALGRGDSIALLTDAGTPTISDPGGTLVERARQHGIEIIAVPGPSAVVAALSVSGLPADRFTFLGFLPRKGADRKSLLASVASSPWTVALFESPRRLVRLLVDLAEACGADRWAVVTRELTKVHEEVKAGTLGDLSGYYRDAAPKGEITVLVARRPEQPQVVDEEIIAQRAREMLAQGESRRDVATRLAKELNVSRKETYRVITKL
jgi:16S rRNA (cytidine1402-2'-O)-methyltransferase